jgi:hypothetical protein
MGIDKMSETPLLLLLLLLLQLASSQENSISMLFFFNLRIFKMGEKVDFQQNSKVVLETKIFIGCIEIAPAADDYEGKALVSTVFVWNALEVKQLRIWALSVLRTRRQKTSSKLYS